MLAKLRTFSLLGIEALPVEVEVDVSPGALPKTVLVGLPEAAVVTTNFPCFCNRNCIYHRKQKGWLISAARRAMRHAERGANDLHEARRKRNQWQLCALAWGR